MASSNPSYVKVNRGAIPTWSDFNALADLVQRQRLRQGVGYRIHEGTGGTTLQITSGAPTSSLAWPFKVYNTSAGAVGQVQINGTDGFVASLNSFVANVNGQPNNVKSGSNYPQLSVDGNGYIYGYAVPHTAGSPTLMSLDIYYGGTIPSLDTANPATYFPWLIAAISNYTVDDKGNVSFTVSNATNYGWTSLYYCYGQIAIY